MACRTLKSVKSRSSFIVNRSQKACQKSKLHPVRSKITLDTNHGHYNQTGGYIKRGRCTLLLWWDSSCFMGYPKKNYTESRVKTWLEKKKKQVKMCSVWYQLEQKELAEVVQSDSAGPDWREQSRSTMKTYIMSHQRGRASLNRWPWHYCSWGNYRFFAPQWFVTFFGWCLFFFTHGLTLLQHSIYRMWTLITGH